MALNTDPIQSIQTLIADYYTRAVDQHGATHVAVVVGVVSPAGAQYLYAGQDTAVNPFGTQLTLDENTPFEIGSVSKAFTSGIFYQNVGDYDGTLSDYISGSGLTMSPAVAGIGIQDLAVYEPGFAQDNAGGVYPLGTLKSLSSLFSYLSTFTPPNTPGTCYAYSNLGWGLVGMAAVQLQTTDTAAFVQQYNASLSEFCRGFGAPSTQVFVSALKTDLPMGYRTGFVPLASGDSYQPCPAVEYPSGGIVSTGADMMQFLKFNMAQLSGGTENPAFFVQQGRTFQVNSCSAGQNGPRTSYAWFHRCMPSAGNGGALSVLSKNGGVGGFTSWMGFQNWIGTNQPSPTGVFVLTNSPGATYLGVAAMQFVLGATPALSEEFEAASIADTHYVAPDDA